MIDLKGSKSGLLIRGSLVRAQLEEPHNASKFGALAISRSLPNLLSEYFRILFPNKITLFRFWRISCITLFFALSACSQECGKYQHAPSPSSVNPTKQSCENLKTAGFEPDFSPMSTNQ